VDDVASSKTNTFTDVLPGVTFTVSKLETGVTLNVADDATAMGNQIKAIVDGVNSARTLIGTQTSYDAKARKGAALTGESLPRELSAKLSAVITNGVSGQSLSKIGIQVDRSGTLTFDQTKFAAALASPTVDTRGLATAFAKSVRDIAADASDATKGTIATQIASGTNTLKRMDTALTNWDDRLSARQTALTRQYAALNVQLQNLQSQQSSLAGAIAQLG
jgi:flagellar hook-associated protein 2